MICVGMHTLAHSFTQLLTSYLPHRSGSVTVTTSVQKAKTTCKLMFHDVWTLNCMSVIAHMYLVTITDA